MDNKDNLANLEHYCNSMHLPLQATLPDGNPVVIDTMTDSQITDMYEMITSAALSGHGYVTDEYPTEKDFRTEIKDGHNFIVCSKDCGKMIAAFSLINSKFYRGSDLTFADPIIIVKRSERGKGIGEFIFGHVVLFSKLLGYSGIYTDTFSNNIAMTKIIERSPGFQHVGHLPIGGKLSDGSFVSANIYFKDLRDPGQPNLKWIFGNALGCKAASLILITSPKRLASSVHDTSGIKMVLDLLIIYMDLFNTERTEDSGARIFKC